MPKISNMLPIQNTANWGQQNNAVLNNINNRLDRIENIVGVDEDNTEISKLGYAGSGVVTYTTNTYENGTIIFNGSIYIGGNVNTYINSISLEIEGTSTYSGVAYVYIKYIETNSITSAADKCSLSLQYTYQYKWNYIMIGIFDSDNNTYIPRVFSPTKTAMQHLDENRKRYGNCNSVSLPTFEDNGNLFYLNTLSGTFTLYNDGYNSTSSLYPIDYDDYKTITISTNNFYYLQDSRNSSTGEITTTNIDEEGHTCTNTSRWYYYRLLLTNSGNFISQSYYNNGNQQGSESINASNLDSLQDTLLNIEFNNNFDNIYLTATDFIELGRYAVHRNSSSTNCFDDIQSSGNFWFYVKSRYNDVNGQGSLNLWSGRTGDLYLDTIRFRNNSNDADYFQLCRNNSSSWTGNYYIVDTTKNTSGSYLMTNTFDASAGTTTNIKIGYYSNSNSKYLQITDSLVRLNYGSDVTGLYFNIDNSNNAKFIFSDNGLTLNGTNASFNCPLVIGTSTSNKDVTINGNINITGEIVFTSDSRAKQNIKNNTHSYLPIVLNTQIKEYHYSNKNDRHIGLIAQELESQLTDDKDLFISVIEDELIPNKLAVKETKLVYILWKAIQEQQKEIEELKQKIK